MMDRDPKLKDRAIAIEYWLAAVITGGAFVAGLISAMKSLLGS